VPISPAGYLGQFNLSSSSYGIANRFVLPKTVTIDRWYFAVNGEGADCVDGRDSYGSGDGGIEFGRIVDVDPATGLPTEQILASESVNGCDAYERAKEEFDLPDKHQVHYVQFAPVTLQADRMYAFVLSNDHSNPGDGSTSQGNHMSANLNFANLDDMGPNAANTLDPNAPGAAYGLDPRETTMWTDDSGETWKFGDEVGWYDVGNGEGRMWPGGYRIAGGPNVPNGWIYMNWPDEGEASITYTAPTAQTLTTAGGRRREHERRRRRHHRPEPRRRRVGIDRRSRHRFGERAARQSAARCRGPAVHRPLRWSGRHRIGELLGRRCGVPHRPQLGGAVIWLCAWSVVGIRYGTLGPHPFSLWGYYTQLDDELFEYGSAFAYFCLVLLDIDRVRRSNASAG
jgi:hypothetical protein